MECVVLSGQDSAAPCTQNTHKQTAERPLLKPTSPPTPHHTTPHHTTPHHTTPHHTTPHHTTNTNTTSNQIARLDADVTWARALDGSEYMPGLVGLNNMRANDYANVVLQALARVPPVRDFFLRPEAYAGCQSALVQRFGELMRKVWNAANFKGQVSPHEFMQAVVLASKRRFTIDAQVWRGCVRCRGCCGRIVCGCAAWCVLCRTPSALLGASILFPPPSSPLVRHFTSPRCTASPHQHHNTTTTININNNYKHEHQHQHQQRQ